MSDEGGTTGYHVNQTQRSRDCDDVYTRNNAVIGLHYPLRPGSGSGIRSKLKLSPPLKSIVKNMEIKEFNDISTVINTQNEIENMKENNDKVNKCTTNRNEYENQIESKTFDKNLDAKECNIIYGARTECTDISKTNREPAITDPLDEDPGIKRGKEVKDGDEVRVSERGRKEERKGEANDEEEGDRLIIKEGEGDRGEPGREREEQGEKERDGGRKIDEKEIKESDGDGRKEDGQRQIEEQIEGQWEGEDDEEKQLERCHLLLHSKIERIPLSCAITAPKSLFLSDSPNSPSLTSLNTIKTSSLHCLPSSHSPPPPPLLSLLLPLSPSPSLSYIPPHLSCLNSSNQSMVNKYVNKIRNHEKKEIIIDECSETINNSNSLSSRKKESEEHSLNNNAEEYFMAPPTEIEEKKANKQEIEKEQERGRERDREKETGKDREKISNHNPIDSIHPTNKKNRILSVESPGEKLDTMKYFMKLFTTLLIIILIRAPICFLPCFLPS